MILLVSGATSTLRDHYRGDRRIGLLFTPRNRQDPAPVIWPGARWAADNGAFSGFDAPAFERMLARLAAWRAGCLFVAAPDVVGDAGETSRLFRAWAPRIRAAGFPVAYVLQDGITREQLPAWSTLEALFVGGSTAFKLSRQADALVQLGRRAGKWIHFGRVNTSSRFRHVYGYADSIDGSAFSRWPAFQIPRAVRWIRHLEQQPRFRFEARS